MTSTPIHHPDGDDPQTRSEDQDSAGTTPEHDGKDRVDEETKKLSHDEAGTHDSTEEAQKEDAEESGGYGY